MACDASFRLRPMVETDLAQVRCMWDRMDGICLSEADELKSLAGYLARNPGLCTVAEDSDGSLIGAVLCGHDGRRGMIHHLAVERDWRRHGLGRALADACCRLLLEHGITKCHLMVHHANDGAHRFWESHGWSDRDDVILMSRYTDDGSRNACTCAPQRK